jgi:serine/threonine protein kinase
MTVNQESPSFLMTPESVPEGSRLGPYRLVKLLGQGGMGMVYLAEDTQLQRTVALKVMLPELARRPAAKERFLREARACAKIEHDNIVTIYQVGEDRGVPYLAMPLLKGMTLEDFITKKGPTLRLEQVLKLGREVAQGLAAAHAQGLVHRDIKPGNIWLDASAGGRAKILDFGLARPSEASAQITQSGTIVGTAAFMAPEQARGGAIDARADLFSFGCVLYRLCTGTMPWQGGELVATLLTMASEPPTPILEHTPGLPPRLTDLIMSLLARKPEDRPRSAQEVVKALKALEDDPAARSMPLPSGARPGGVAAKIPGFALLTRRPRLTLAVALAGCLMFAVLTVTAAALVYSYTRSPDTGTVRLETNHDSVRVIVEQNGKQVEVLDKANDMKAALPPGEYHLRLVDDTKTLKLDASQIEVTRNEMVVVTLTEVKEPAYGETPRDPPKDRPHRGPWRRPKR